MYQFLNKHGQAAAFGLGMLITVLFFIQVITGLSTFNTLGKEDQIQSGIFNFGLWASIVLSIICVIALLVFGVWDLTKSSKTSIRSLIPFLSLLAIFVVTFILAQPATEGPMLAVAERFELTTSQEKFISAGLMTSIILSIIAGAAFAFSELRNFFK